MLELDLSHGVQFGAPSSPLEAFRLRQAPTLRALQDGLRRAASDDDVLGLLVHVGTAPLTLAQADEIAELVADFSQDKPSVAWTETFGELTSGLVGYRVALGADQIWVQPTGALGLVGVQTGMTLLRGGLEKLGVDPEFGQRYEFKTAADTLAAREITPAYREMMQRLADAVLDDTVTRTSARRGLDEAAVREAIDRAPLSADAALSAGLVDRLGYADEVYAWAHDTWTPQWEPRYVHRYAADYKDKAAALGALTRRSHPAVAVVDVHGSIVLGPGNGRQAGAERVCARLREAGRDDDVRGVVLRVDSPGGSYVASDAIRREVLRLRESGRPVVASMGTVAASGGYFVSMGADEIIAQPTTLTGSIGVLAGKMVIERLLERAGIVHDNAIAGPRAAMMAASRPFTTDERAVLDAWLDEVYADFTQKAATDRGMALATLEPLARGRVWVGSDAAERDLVDHLGGSRLALERVCALAEIDVDDVRLHTPSALDLLRQLKPAESSQSPAAAGVAGSGPLSRGPEALLARVSEAIGLPVTHGVLSLPPGVSLDGDGWL